MEVSPALPWQPRCASPGCAAARADRNPAVPGPCSVGNARMEAQLPVGMSREGFWGAVAAGREAGAAEGGESAPPALEFTGKANPGARLDPMFV